jgi:SAM-dependent methyltransferase
MNFLNLKDISERDMELVNPTSPEKVLAVGRAAGMSHGKRVIDFGCGFGEALALWAERYGIGGVGIDIRPKACERARAKMQARSLTERIEIACMNAAEHVFTPHTFDVAACIGASFIWGGYRPTLQHLREAIKPDGAVIIGEPYWLNSNVPPEYSRREQVHTEFELLQIAREEGFDVVYVARASHDEWDRYERDNWQGLMHWLRENPDHPDRQQVLDHLRGSQDEYFRYAREYFGWAMYVLVPTKSFV